MVQRELKLNKDKIFPYLILTAVALAILFLPLGSGDFFGSEGDWYSQHVGAAEMLRQMMLETGSIIPQYSSIGGGSNIYDFAYYGLLRPDILFSCFVPELEMKYIIAGYAAFGVIASVNLMYFWLRRQGISSFYGIFGTVIFICSTAFYHAHHQIMFVNYMPFLLMALMGVDRLICKGKSELLIVSLFLIYIHSYFFAVSCLAVCAVYFFFKVMQPGCISNKYITIGSKDFVRLAGKVAAAVIISIGLAAILLLPTGLDILSTYKDGGKFMEESMGLFDPEVKGLLYTPYGAGMTLLTLYCLLLSLWDKKRRIVAAVLLATTAIPVISLTLNGFLYPRPKILIPFITLIVWISTMSLQEVNEGREKWRIFPAVLCFLPAVFSPKGELIVVDSIILILWVIFEKLYEKNDRIRNAIFCLILIVPICVSLGANKTEDYLSTEDNRQSHFTAGDITVFASDHRYRYDALANNYVNCNLLADGSLHRTAMYSSVTNYLYEDFYYNTMRNPISLRNRVVLMPNENSFFNYFMGIRYVTTKGNHIPYGYGKVFERDGYVLAENKDVLPICYGTSNLLTEDEFKKLEFPETLEALTCEAVVSENTTKAFNSHIKEEEPKDFFAGDADFSKSGTVPLVKPLRGSLVLIEFHVNNPNGEEITIEINGMRNTLSGETAPYPNDNHRFTFILNSGEKLNSLSVKVSKGEIEINDLHVYTMDAKYLHHPNISVPTLEENSEPDGRTMFKGKIDMEKDGYFITSFPYRKGYKITVDGKGTKPEKVNTAFIGFPLDMGNHQIEIVYDAPGFVAGKKISLISATLLLLIMIIELKGRKENE